jgi:hypothetical protein
MPLVKARTELRPDWRDTPLAYWVHKEVPAGNWRAAPSYLPAAPKPHGRKGYPFLVVDFGRATLEFSSAEQLSHFVEVLSATPLPTSRRLSADRGAAVGPNGHWLSRLPSTLKSPKTRAQLVEALEGLPPDVWQVTPDKSLKRPRGR